MEKKQNISSGRGLSGKILIASLFILSGILLFTRNMGWITYELFDLLVSWYSLLIILGGYAIFRRHYLSGIILLLVGAYFFIGGLSWLPENSQAMVWPVALVLAGILYFVKARRRERWIDHHMRRHWKWQANRSMNGGDGMGEPQVESDNGFLRLDNAFSGTRHVVLDELFKGAVLRVSCGGTSIDLRHTHIAAGETYIDLDCSWGGIELLVPSEWIVVFKCNAFCGGCEDKRWKNTNANSEYVLVVRGNLSFGGVTVKD